MLKNGFLTHIAQYLKITPKVIFGFRNVLEIPNLDHWHLLGVSQRVQSVFWKFRFFWPVFSALQAKNGQNFYKCSNMVSYGCVHVAYNYWVYITWFRLISDLGEWPWKPFSHFRIRANEGDMNSLTVVNVNISIWIKL